MDRVVRDFAANSAPTPQDVTTAFWCACHGGQRGAAEYLQDRGADINWIVFDKLTPLDAARRSGAEELAKWLYTRGAQPADRRDET